MSAQNTQRDEARTPRLMTARFARIMLGQTTFGFGWSLFLLAPKFYATQLQASAETIGYLSAMGGLFGVATIPFAARGIDRVGRKAFFRLGSLVLAALSLGFLAVDSIGPLVFLLNGLNGAAFVLAFNASATLATDEAPTAKLGQAIGVLGASNMIMNGVSTIVGEKLAATSGWHAVFGLGAAAGLLAFGISFGMPEAPRPPRVLSAAQARDELPLGALAPLLCATALIGASFCAMFVFYQPYALSLGAKVVNEFFVGFTLTAVTTRIAFGNLGDRFGRLRISVYAAGVYAIAAAAMTQLQPGLLLAYGALFGLAHGVLYPTLNAVVMERVGIGARGRAMTLYNGAFNVGTTLSSLAWGNIAQHRGYPTVYVGAAALAVTAAACLLLPVRTALVDLGAHD
jgi:MFS family permease